MMYKIHNLINLPFFKTGVEDPYFAYGLLMELTRAFLAYADNVRAQDSASYAIQVRNLVYLQNLFFFNLKTRSLCVNKINSLLQMVGPSLWAGIQKWASAL